MTESLIPSAPTKQPVLLREYAPPAWWIDKIELTFDLACDVCEISARLQVRRNLTVKQKPLRLDGEDLELLEIRLDGRLLTELDYLRDAHSLTLSQVDNNAVIETRVRIYPARNTALQGLYLSGNSATGFLLTQCEAEGFRRITYAVDRPDAMARYTVTLRADRCRFPVLLANGNPDGAGELPEGLHWARWVDPHPKPSYLFAMVAGQLECIQESYTTSEGRKVQLCIFAENDAIDRCAYAMNSLKRAMRWDEQKFGRNYDLDVFNIVATHQFNMGAMENKGLNIFNTKYLLADPDTTTDTEYRHVEAVIGHEYFHNWTGNRITCRDWFQLSLKEGLTVYREQEFSADMGARGLKRIEDVQTLLRAQFTEDAGPLAHPVRPDRYLEINNFYTATVYDKGAEIVRMLAVALGPERFRRGMDAYFERFDGQAVRIEDFLDALGSVNQEDLSSYLLWYCQAGTPHLHAQGHYDASNRCYTLRLRQFTAPTPDQPQKAPLPIPVAISLFDSHGQAMPLTLAGEAPGISTERILPLTVAEQDYCFVNIPAEPVPSLLRGFSAPVVLQYNCSYPQLALLIRHDSDPFNRWLAAQQLGKQLFFDTLRETDSVQTSKHLDVWLRSMTDVLAESERDPALVAELLTLPSEIILTESLNDVDPDRIHTARDALEQTLVETLESRLQTLYNKLHQTEDASLEPLSQARRSLQNRCLELLCTVNSNNKGLVLAEQQFYAARTMTTRLAALTCLVHRGASVATSTLMNYFERHRNDPVALDKWFAVQASSPLPDCVEQVRALLIHPAFRLTHPNTVYALLGTLAQRNRVGFHRADGSGYVLLAEQIAILDRINPNVAARLASAFNTWRRLEPARRQLMQLQLQRLQDLPEISVDLQDILQRALAENS